MASCDVLDVESQSAVPEDKAIKDKAGVEKAILGSYTALQNLGNYGRSYIIFADLAADNLEHSVDGTAQNYAQIDNNAVLPENGAVSDIWDSGYEGINIANNVIEKVPDIADMPVGLGLLLLQYVSDLLCLLTGRAPPFGIEGKARGAHA